MEKKFIVQIPKTVHRMVSIYYIVGLWRSGNGRISVPRTIYSFAFSAFILFSFIGACTTDDKDNAVFLAVQFLVGALQVYRLHFIFFNQNRILSSIHAIGVNDTDDYVSFCNADSKMKKLMNITKVFIVITYSMSVAVVYLPLVKKKLLFDIAFPLDYKTNESAFWMAYGLVAGVYILSATVVMSVSMMWYMMLIFVIKYDFLANELTNLGIPRNENKREKLVLSVNSSPRNNPSYVQHLIAAIKRLKNVNEQLDEFQSMFSSLFLFQIVTSSLCICGITFVLAFRTRDNLFQDAFYFVEAFFCYADIFSVLYLGNEIKLSFERLSYSLFASNWIDQTQSYRKHILIVVEYLKHPKEFVVGKLFPINLETFTAIVSRSFSLFNVLRKLQL